MKKGKESSIAPTSQKDKESYRRRHGTENKFKVKGCTAKIYIQWVQEVFILRFITLLLCGSLIMTFSNYYFILKKHYINKFTY